MAPKGPKRRVAAAPAAAPPASPAPGGFDDATIAALLCEVEHNLDVIRKHKVFKDIMDAEPLPIAAGGNQAPFNQDNFQQVMHSGESYTCGINFMWIGHKLRAMAGVPISHRAINMFLTSNRFENYKFSSVIEIAADNKEYKPLEHKGALLRLSAPEESFALIWQIKKDIENNVPTEKLKKWRTCLLTVTARFMIVESAEDRWWHEYNYREDVNLLSEALVQTTYQRFCGISRLLDQAASVNPGSSIAHVAQMFAAKTREGGNNSDKVTETYIKEVILVREHVLSNKKVCSIVQDMDEKYGHTSVFNSIYKLGALKRQAKTAAMIEWVVEGIQDTIVSECAWLTDTPPSLRDFTTTAAKSIVGVFVHKKGFLSHILQEVETLLPRHIATKMREVFTDYSSFRAVQPAKTNQQPELTFMAEWPVPARMMFTFIADACFLCQHPFVHPFQNSFRSGRAATAVLEYSAVEEQLSKIKRLAAEIKQDEKVADEIGGDTAMIGTCHDSRAAKDDEDADGDGNGVDPTEDSAKEETGSRIAFWRKFAEETVRSCISLRPVPSTENELVEMLKTCDASKVKVVHGDTTFIKFYDEKMASEALSAPTVRKPPHRVNYFKLCIGAGLASNHTGKCSMGEWYVVLDNGKNALQSMINKTFTGYADHCQTYDLLVDEESLIQRRGRRSKKLLKQSERMFVFTHDANAIRDEKRKYYKGSSKGQSWGFISLTPYNHVWHVAVDKKKAAYGEAMRPVGGKASKEDEDSADETEFAMADDTERVQEGVPFCYHGLPLLFFKDLLHVSHGKAVIDFTPGDGNFAIAVLECKGSVLYFGLCHTELHCQLLRDYLSNYVLEAMQKEGNPLFNEQCAAEMKGKGIKDKEEEEEDKVKKKRKPKGKDKEDKDKDKEGKDKDGKKKRKAKGKGKDKDKEGKKPRSQSSSSVPRRSSSPSESSD